MCSYLNKMIHAQLIFLCAITVSAFVLIRGVAVLSAQPKVELVVGPYLQNVTKHSITVMWETNWAKAPTKVEYGKTAEYGFTAEIDELKPIHEVVLSGLTPETVYHYRVIAGDFVSNDYTFKTAVNENSPFQFAVYGDNQRGAERYTVVAAEVKEKHPDFIMHVGDAVSWGPLGKDQWRDQFFTPAKDLLPVTPFYAALGNHEKNTPDFYEYMANPEPENYYSFDYGNAHFIVLDANYISHWHGRYGQGYWPVQGFPGSAPSGPVVKRQLEWLEKDLQTAHAEWIFVFFHQPCWASYAAEASSQEQMRVLCPIFEQYDVDVVFNGHDHFYERMHPLTQGKIDQENGVTYIVTGGAGGGLERPDPPGGSYFTAKLKRIYHFNIVKINGKKFSMTTYGIPGLEDMKPQKPVIIDELQLTAEK